MTVQIGDELHLALTTVGFTEKIDLLAMHLSEIEEEAGNVLDLLTALRAHTYRGDAAAGEEALAELTIALEHLAHHLNEALPNLQKQLNIEPE
ncbi:MAG: hypothetical protein HYR94_12325 [Chloroflexi bacterium]|nr:hypothetical protein [Chloroflexota bacterium]